MRLAGGIQRQGGVLAHISHAVHRLDLPRDTAEGGVLQVAVGVIVVTDVRPVGSVQGQGGVPAHVSCAIHCLGDPGDTVKGGVLQVAVGVIVVTDVRPAEPVQRQGGEVAHVSCAVHRLDVPDASIEEGVLQGAAAVVTDVRPAGGIQRQGGVPAHVSCAVHRLDVPGSAIEVGILQVVVGIRSVVTDVRPAGGIQRQGGVLAHLSWAIHRLDVPGRSVEVGVLQVSVGHVPVTHVRIAGSIQGQGGVPAYRFCALRGIYRFLVPGRPIVPGIVQAVATVGDMGMVKSIERQGPRTALIEILGGIHLLDVPGVIGGSGRGFLAPLHPFRQVLQDAFLPWLRPLGHCRRQAQGQQQQDKHAGIGDAPLHWVHLLFPRPRGQKLGRSIFIIHPPLSCQDFLISGSEQPHGVTCKPL